MTFDGNDNLHEKVSALTFLGYSKGSGTGK
jgi:hypothetical protein